MKPNLFIVNPVHSMMNTVYFIINKDCELSGFSVPLHPKTKTIDLKWIIK